MRKLEPGHKTERLFVQKLLEWNRKTNDRNMPWKGEKDPYKIWLSEVILQQTRVEQGLKYYESFINTFPRIQDLAQASEKQVFKLWEGLGYYSRCRNLLETARLISQEHKGGFPTDYDSILQLKGVGPYTAAAIASFAYNLPHAVLDGNVFRVLSRVFDLETPIDSAEGKKQFAQTAQAILPPSKAGEYNQAIMDFGAVLCKPVPECSHCFFRHHCRAYLTGKQQLLPVKGKKAPVKERWLNYVVVRHKQAVAIRQRVAKDIWPRLFEFALVETAASLPYKQVLKQFEKQYGLTDYLVVEHFERTRQRLSHQLLSFQFILIETAKKEKIDQFSWVPFSGLNQFAFPKTLRQFMDEHLI